MRTKNPAQNHATKHDVSRAFFIVLHSLKSVQVVTVIMLKPVKMSEIYTRNGHEAVSYTHLTLPTKA